MYPNGTMNRGRETQRIRTDDQHLGRDCRWLYCAKAGRYCCGIPMIVAVSITLLGCRSMSSRANPDWIADLNRADTIVIRVEDASTTIVDEDTIRRFVDIYANAKWEPYWHTLPADGWERSIELMVDGEQLRDFAYTGVLWESEGYDSNRTATLAAADQQWMESLFDEISTTDAQQQ